MRCFASAISFVEVFCVYGYSFAIFVPSLALCTIPSNVTTG